MQKRKLIQLFLVVLLQIFKLWYFGLYHDRKHSKREQLKNMDYVFRQIHLFNVLTLDPQTKMAMSTEAPTTQ